MYSQCSDKFTVIFTYASTLYSTYASVALDYANSASSKWPMLGTERWESTDWPLNLISNVDSSPKVMFKDAFVRLQLQRAQSIRELFFFFLFFKLKHSQGDTCFILFGLVIAAGIPCLKREDKGLLGGYSEFLYCFSGL